MYLNSINKNEYYVVDKINADEKIKRRLYDIGLSCGTKVKLLLNSPSKRIKAYLIRDSIIAIRNIDASKIEVKELND